MYRLLILEILVQVVLLSTEEEEGMGSGEL
jgi:hypothetical protein